MLDGTPTLRLNEFMLGGIEGGKIPLELSESERAKDPMPKPEEITFELDKHLEEVVAKSKQGFGEEMALQDLEVGDEFHLDSNEADFQTLMSKSDGSFPGVWQEPYQDFQSLARRLCSDDQATRILPTLC